jgi:hypothetical protein
MKLTRKSKELLLTGKGDINLNWVNLISKVRFEGDKIYPKEWKGSKRYMSLSDGMPGLKQVLNAQGYKFTEGNDAPRGGVEGDFIKVSKVAMTFLIGIRNSKN